MSLRGAGLVLDHPANPVEEIKGHRDFYNTECPGEALYAKLPQLRKEVASTRT